MKNGLPPTCNIHCYWPINCESTLPGLKIKMCHFVYATKKQFLSKAKIFFLVTTTAGNQLQADTHKFQEAYLFFFLSRLPSLLPPPPLLSPGNFPTRKAHQARRHSEDRETGATVQCRLEDGGRERCHWEEVPIQGLQPGIWVHDSCRSKGRQNGPPPRVVQCVQQREHHPEYTRVSRALQSRCHTGKVHWRSSKVTTTFDDLLTAFSFCMTSFKKFE